MPAYDSHQFDPPAPVVRVSFRNPASEEIINGIPMLIDSGADVTFMPRPIVVQLRLSMNPGEAYTFKAVDGKTGTAESVRADMLFLGTTFRGRYLIRDAAVGILG